MEILKVEDWKILFEEENILEDVEEILETNVMGVETLSLMRSLLGKDLEHGRFT